MRKATFLYNPASGRKLRRRLEDVESAAAVVRAAGVEVVVTPTRAAGSAGEQAREAVAAGCDAVFACGGDGTVHEALQGMIEAGGAAALGIIPLGTGNALALDLGLPNHPAKAARMQVEAEPRRLAAGKMECQDFEGRPASRYFTVMAGTGPNALLVYAMAAGWKERYGMAAYALQAGLSWATARFAPFEVEFVDAASGERRRQVVAEVLAARVSDFPFPLRRVAPGAALSRDDMRLILFRPPVRLRYLAHLSGAMVGIQWKVPGVELLHTTEITCRPLEPCPGTSHKKPARIFAEADGELLGTLPARFSMVPNAFTLLIPRGR
jgi:diacylglycerol kinase family enzyme